MGCLFQSLEFAELPNTETTIEVIILHTLCEFYIGNATFQISNSKCQIPNAKFQMPNSKFQIPNSKFQTPNSKFQSSNSYFWVKKNGRRKT
jgi:hypothetical protein